jgi:RNA polymerase sigma-70 factor (ECF subfamily)
LTAAALHPDSWVDQHAQALYHYALLRLRDPNAAEEVVQETLLAALEGRHRFAGRASPRTWLAGILKHKIVDQIRRSSRERPANGADATEALDDIERRHFSAAGRWRCGPADWLIDPEAVCRRQELRRHLAVCLERLPPRLARVFSLRELEQLSSDEICDLLDISRTNLWVMLHRARLAMRACLEELWAPAAAGAPAEETHLAS